MKKNIEGINHRPFAPAIGQYSLTEKSTEEINKYINSFFFFIIEKKISHLENKAVVIINEKAVQIVL